MHCQELLDCLHIVSDYQSMAGFLNTYFVEEEDCSKGLITATTKNCSFTTETTLWNLISFASPEY